MKNPINLFLAISIIILVTVGQANAQGWQWGRIATGPQLESWMVAKDTAGNVYGGGYRVGGSGTIDFGSGVTLPSTTDASSVWVKYNNLGTPLWVGSATGGNLNSMTVDPSGNLILFGTFQDTIHIGSFTLTNSTLTASKFFLAKVSPSGTVLWAISDGRGISLAFFFSEIFAISAVTTDAAGSIYITSSFWSPTITIGSTTLTNMDPLYANTDVFVAKYNSAGIFLWARSFGGSLSDFGIGITVASTGNVYVTGYFQSITMIIGPDTLAKNYAVSTQAFIAKFSPSGVPLWAQNAGNRNFAYGVGLDKDNYGSVYMVGGFTDTSISFGNDTVTRTYPAVVPNPALFLVKYLPSNTVAWSKTIGSPSVSLGSLWGYSVAVAPCGQVWVSGGYTDTANIDGHILPEPPGSGFDPSFIAGFTLAGDVVGYTNLSSGGEGQNMIACDASGNVLICGDIRPPATVIMGPDTIADYSSGDFFFIGKYINTITATLNINDTSACSGSSIILAGTPGFLNFYWSDGTTDSLLTVTSTGTYFVNNISCGAVLVDTFHVTFSPADTLHHNYDSIVCASNDAYLNIGLTAPVGNNYSWFDGTTGAADTVHRAGTYGVTYSTGCNFNIDSFKVTVFSPCNLGVPQPVMANKVEIYPNPATGELTINADGTAYQSLTITNSISQVLIRQRLNPTQTKVDIQSLPAGLYFIALKGENGSVVKKFVKQ